MGGPYRCTTCGGYFDTEDLRDALSRQEARISGMCQECQDFVFEEGDEDDPYRDEDDPYRDEWAF